MDTGVSSPSLKSRRSPRRSPHSPRSPRSPGSPRNRRRHKRRHHRKHGTDGVQSPSSPNSPSSQTSPSTSSGPVLRDTSSPSVPLDGNMPHPLGFSGRVYPRSPYPLRAPSPSGPPDKPDHTKERYKTLALKCAAIAVVVVIVLSVAAVGVIMKRRNTRRPAGHTATECTTKSCLEYKDRFHDAIDDGENPCDNFYKYVCGAWIDVHDPGLSVTAKVWTDFIAKVASNIESRDAPKEQQASVRKAAVYLQACLGVLNKSNVAGVKSILAEAGIVWPERNPKPDFLNAVFFMSTYVNMPVLFQPTLTARNVSTYDIFLRQWEGFHTTMRTLETILDMGRLVDHMKITYECFGGSKDADRARELTVQMKNVTEFLAKYVKDYNNEISYRNVSAFLQLTPTILKERWDKLYETYTDRHTVSGAVGVAIENEPYVDAVFHLHQQLGEAAMNDVVESLCIQNLVAFTDIRIIESFYGNSETTESAVRDVCFSVGYSIFGYVINNLFLRTDSVPYQEVVRFAENISREIPVLLHGNSSLLDKSESRDNFERVFHVLNMSQRASYPPIYERYPDMTKNPLANWIHVLNAIKMDHEQNIDTFLRYDYKDINFKNFVLKIPYLWSPVYSSDAHWGIRYGGIGARIAATVFCDYVEGSDNAQQIYQKNQDCLSNKSGDKIDANLQAAVASADITWALYEKERAKAKADDPLFMNIWPLQSEQIPFVFGCYLMCGQKSGEEMCNAPFRHSSNFARAFKCAEGSPMNPKKKCWMLPP